MVATFDVWFLNLSSVDNQGCDILLVLLCIMIHATMTRASTPLTSKTSSFDRDWRSMTGMHGG